MWSAARCLAAFEGRLPGACEVDVTWRRPIPLPSTVTFAEGPGLAFSLRSAGGAPHLRGNVTAL
jgi:hypothetical protein